MGAAGLSLSLASGASAATVGPAAHEITLGEEEISDVTLATFYVFDKENPRAHPAYNSSDTEAATAAMAAMAATEAAITAAEAATEAATAAEVVEAVEAAGGGISPLADGVTEGAAFS